MRKKAGGLVGRWSKKTKERNQKSRELWRGNNNRKILGERKEELNQKLS